MTKEQSKEYRKKYYEKNKEYYKKYAENHKEKIRETHKAAYKMNKEKYLTRTHACYQKRRLAVLNYYSNGKIECNCCGECIYKFLAIDHIDNRYGSGKEHRKLNGQALQDWIVKNNFPEGFQILCHNCNIGKWTNKGTCPHKAFT